MSDDARCPDCGAAMRVMGGATGETWEYRHRPGSPECLRRQLTQEEATVAKLRAEVKNMQADVASVRGRPERSDHE